MQKVMTINRKGEIEEATIIEKNKCGIVVQLKDGLWILNGAFVKEVKDNEA